MEWSEYKAEAEAHRRDLHAIGADVRDTSDDGPSGPYRVGDSYDPGADETGGM